MQHKIISPFINDVYTHIIVTKNVSYTAGTMLYGDTSVCLEVSISNVIPESLDICPQLHLKQISQSSGITLLIHTPPDTHWTTCTCTCNCILITY